MSNMQWRHVPQATRVTCRHCRRRQVPERNSALLENGNRRVVGPAATGRGGRMTWHVPPPTEAAGRPPTASCTRVTALIPRLHSKQTALILRRRKQGFWPVMRESCAALPPSFPSLFLYRMFAFLCMALRSLRCSRYTA